MQQFLAVLWRPADSASEDFASELIRRGTAALEQRPAALTINTAGGPRSPISRKRADGSRIGGLASIAARDTEHAQSIAAALDASAALYRVETAVPVEYERSWPLATPSPGIKQVTFLRRKPGLSDAEFLQAWHGVHTPLAIEVHPLWRYVRSVVVDVIGDGPAYEGIVELHFRTVDDVTDPTRFYGDRPDNAARIAADVRGWIDFDTIDIAHMHETVLAEVPC
jgi:hypothetical protein